jgi:hypothetical protein|tara:strand:- start:133 stop:396 length:264 start_codon:yes stop_codon:yes gene_type:complete
MFITMSDGTRYEVPAECQVVRSADGGKIGTPAIRQIAGTKAERQVCKAKRDTRKPSHRWPRLQESEMNRRIRVWQKTGRKDGDGYAR